MLAVYLGLCRQTFTLERRDGRKAHRRERRDTEAKKELFVILFILYILRKCVNMCECHLQRQNWICPEIIHDLMKDKKKEGEER